MKLMKFKYPQLNYILLLVSIAFLTHIRWLSFDTFSAGDWWYAFPETLREYLAVSIWNTLYGFGYFDLIFWRLPIFNIPYGLLAGLGFGQEVTEKIFIFWPTVIFANIFSFLLFRKITQSNLASFVGALVFNYNTYYLIIGGGFLIYSAAPWILLTILLFMTGLEKNRKYLYALSGATLFIAGSYDFRIGYIGFFILLFYYLYYFFFINIHKISFFVLKKMVSPFITFFFFVLLNIYWILPTANLGSLTNNTILDRSLFGNEFLNILYAFTLYHPFWTGGNPAIFVNQPIPLYFWAIPVFVILGLMTTKNKNVLFFGIVALLGVFLSKQVSQPLSGVYPWLFEYFPGFNAFREASKFYFLIALGYAVLIAAFVNWLWQNRVGNNVQKYGKYIITLLIVGIFLWNTKPFISGEIATMYIPRTIPNDYLVFKNFILKQNDYFRTLWVPILPRWAIGTNNNPVLGGTDIHMEWKNLFPKQKDMETEAEVQMRMMKNPLSNPLLDAASIKYIIVPLQERKGDDFFPDYGKERAYYIQQLDKIPYLTKIDAGTEHIVVYENKNFRPHVYATEEKDTLQEDNAIISGFSYKMIHPFEYTFSIKHISRPFYLNFSESYHPQWHLRIGNVQWFDSLVKDNYFIENNHFKTDAGFNGYYVDPKQICKEFYCVKHADGSFDISGTLYFKPQSYMYLGLWISGMTAIMVLGWSLVIFGRKFYEKK